MKLPYVIDNQRRKKVRESFLLSLASLKQKRLARGCEWRRLAKTLAASRIARGVNRVHATSYNPSADQRSRSPFLANRSLALGDFFFANNVLCFVPAEF